MTYCQYLIFLSFNYQINSTCIDRKLFFWYNQNEMKKRVAVGLSGGVDSAVAALLLKEQGYEVIGIFMKNWQEEDCSAQDDYEDIKKICARIDIPYYTVNFSADYWDKVFLHFVEEYKKGRTPNPDVLCNKEIKFGPFKEWAQKLGAEYIATGHYAGILEEDNKTYLVRAKDENKDQTYFLNQVSNSQLQNVLFPLCALYKSEVRELAKERNLPVAEKKDSTGICFIGERKFREFLAGYIPMKKGVIIDSEGKIVGEHNGVFYYTLGQRRGLGLGGSTPKGGRWFVTGKDVQKNILYVSLTEPPSLYTKLCRVNGINYITDKVANGAKVLVRIRHRQPLQQAQVELAKAGSMLLHFETPQRALAPGQYAVMYKDRICLGGGVIEDRI